MLRPCIAFLSMAPDEWNTAFAMGAMVAADECECDLIFGPINWQPS